MTKTTVWIDEAADLTPESVASVKAEAESHGRRLGTLFLSASLFELLGRPEHCAPNPQLPVMPEPKLDFAVEFSRERGHPLNPGRHRPKRRKKL